MLNSSPHKLAVAAMTLAALLFFAPEAEAHTVEICWKANPSGTVTFYAATYHTPSSPVGGIIIDGVRYNFTSVSTARPADVDACFRCPSQTSPNRRWQVVEVGGLASGTHSISTTTTSSVEWPWGCFPVTANIEICVNTVITFSETIRRGIGWNGESNNFLISSDGDYRLDFYRLGASGHDHVFSSGVENNHNFSRIDGRQQGVRVARIDGQPFTLLSMVLRGQAAIGQLGSQALYAGGSVSFGSTFSNVTQVFIGDPHTAGGFSDSSHWDNIVLNACPTNTPPNVTCPAPDLTECVAGVGSIAMTAGLFDADGDPLDVEWKVDGVSVRAVSGTTAASDSLTHTFALGTSIVEVIVSDGQETQRCEVKMTVQDTNPAIVSCRDVTFATNRGTCESTMLPPQPGISEECGIDTITNDAPSTFPLGTTTVTWTIIDLGGNVSTCTSEVTVVDRERPTITCPPDVTVAHDFGSCDATGVALGSPVTADNCGVASITNDAPASFPVGTNIVVWTVADASGGGTVCKQLVTVTNQDPVASAGADKFVFECSSPAGASETLDGTSSSDPDGNTPLSYEWAATGITFDDDTSATPTATFPIGSTIVVLTVTDACGAKNSTNVLVVVEDTTAPVIEIVEADKDMLWPPNHKMHTVALSVTVSDACASPGDLILACSVSSDEPDDDRGDGKTTGDVDGQDGLLAPVPVTLTFNAATGKWEGTLQLRAERDGRADGRKYSIHCSASDPHGNSTDSTTCVVVPHDQN